jgi:hypothetical protein
MNKFLTVSMVLVCIAMFIACGGKGDKNKDGGGGGQAKDGGSKDGGSKEAKAGFKLGDEISFNDSKWVVMTAEDKGKTLTSNNQFQKDATSADGKFILIQFKVTNLGNKEQRLINTPKVIDSKGREFKHMDKQAFYIPKDAKTMTLEALPASLSREFYGVYEVPADATGLKFQTRDLSSLISPDYKLVELGF